MWAIRNDVSQKGENLLYQGKWRNAEEVGWKHSAKTEWGGLIKCPYLMTLFMLLFEENQSRQVYILKL